MDETKKRQSWVFATVMILIFAVPFVFFIVIPALQDSALDSKGHRGTGTVRAFANTGVYYNHRPQIAFQVDIVPADGTPEFHTACKKVVTEMDGPRFQVGSVHPMRFLPDDHKTCRFDD